MIVDDKPVSKITPQVIWAMIAFVGGSLFSAGMGWGRSSTSIDTLTTSISILTAKVETLTSQFNAAQGDSRERLRAVEDSVKQLQEDVRDLKTTHAK